MPAWTSLCFEIKSIQSYIFSSGRLRDIIGASELIDLLTNDQAPENLLDAVLHSIEAEEMIQFSRRAGGALYAFSEDEALLRRFAALWTLSMQNWAPGLGYAMGWGEGLGLQDAFDNARRDLQKRSSVPIPALPFGAPIAQRAPRTGSVAVEFHRKDGPIDAATVRKKAFADLAHAGFVGRFSPPEAELGWKDWPRNLEHSEDGGDFPFKGERRFIAVLHADGNGMGQTLMNIRQAVQKSPDRFLNYYKGFSKALDASTQHAAREAARQVLIPARDDSGMLPARPILLGGDDVTVIVRADLALAYARCFAQAFEHRSATELAKLRKQGIDGLPGKLTIGFGIAYMRASQPFYMAVNLAESLMEAAKSQAKKNVAAGTPTPSSVVFHRITAALPGDYADALKTDLSHQHGRQRYIHTLGAYALLDDSQPAGTAAHSPLPRLADLQSLQDMLHAPDMARGPTRQLLDLIELDPTQATIAWRRWKKRMKEHKPDVLHAFHKVMTRLLPIDPAG
ncbi:MAG: hypothetical protein U7M05_11675 [Candidatus Igneacidithiobacillus chanchocoensis]